MRKQTLFWAVCYLLLLACQDGSPSNNEDQNPPEETEHNSGNFIFGVDLSFVNQVIDHGATDRDSGSVENPYNIFAEFGANLARFRLWHNPEWVRNEVYTNQDVPLYSGLEDVTKSIEEAKAQGLSVNLDFHYSDTWADPQQQGNGLLQT